jgi:hypothetical protein
MGLMNCDKYRKFYALTRFKPQKRWENWSHVSLPPMPFAQVSTCFFFLRELH